MCPSVHVSSRVVVCGHVVSGNCDPRLGPVFRWLLKACENPNEGVTVAVLDFILNRLPAGIAKVVVNGKGIAGETLLMIVSFLGHCGAIERLVAAGAAMNTAGTGVGGATAVYLASQQVRPVVTAKCHCSHSRRDPHSLRCLRARVSSRSTA